MSDPTAVPLSEAGRPIRGCDVCGGVDDHPRHVFTGANAPANQEALKAVLDNESLASDVKSYVIAALTDTTLQERHMDCCASSGCPDGSCTAIHASTSAPADQPLVGQALLSYIESGAVDHIGEELNAQRLAEANQNQEA
jgi:hypothetical protein